MNSLSSCLVNLTSKPFQTGTSDLWVARFVARRSQVQLECPLRGIHKTGILDCVKITDDYKAKIKMWAANPQVPPDLSPKNPPKFKCQRFSSYEEMNAWKKALWEEWAREVEKNPQHLQDVECLLEMKKWGRL